MGKIRAAIVGLLTVSFLAVFSPAAFAANGSFPWTASFDNALNSRNWTQKAGTTTIVSNISCSGPVQVYYMRLYRNETIDDQIGNRVEFACGSSQQFAFSVPKAGTYHFKLEKANDGGHDSGSGTVTYPSS